MAVARGRGRGLGSRRVTRTTSRRAASGKTSATPVANVASVKQPRYPWDYPNLPEAQKRHEELQAQDPKHDLSSCVCCCFTCDGTDAEDESDAQVHADDEADDRG